MAELKAEAPVSGEQAAPIDISSHIWDMKYRYKSGDKILDRTVEDTWRRVADAVAEVESDPAAWRQPFYDLLADYKFLPGGRILANAGTRREKTTMFNCYVMNRIPDSLGGIFEVVRESALTQKQGGGVGFDFSSIRPQGDHIEGVDSEASGPISFMHVFDATCKTIMSAGQRRGAQMAVLRCDHPDIARFITAKQTPGALTMFNLSVACTDAFMEAVASDSDWDLKFSGKVYQTVRARELWEKIMTSTYNYAEPGVIFIDRVNQMNNLHYCETIAATNPCVTGRTWVFTDEGPRQVKELVGRPFRALIDGQPCASGPQGFFSTGRKEVLRLSTVPGVQVYLTADHPVRVAHRLADDSYRFEWTPAGKLAEGDVIVLHDHRRVAGWAGRYDRRQGRLLGLFMARGHMAKDVADIRLRVEPREGRPDCVSGSELLKDVRELAATLNAGPVGTWGKTNEAGERRLAVPGLAALCRELGLGVGTGAATPELERSSSDFHLGFVQGFFDSRCEVAADHDGRPRLRLFSAFLDRLEALQRMLLRFGINSKIYREYYPIANPPQTFRRGPHYLSDHELLIRDENVRTFAQRIGFGDPRRQAALQALLAESSVVPDSRDPQRYLSRVAKIEPAGVKEVYDVQVPGVNAFDANGLYVHNCGEQPLPPYGACLLGSLNLTRFVRHPFSADCTVDYEALAACTRTAVRFLDNVIELSNYPLQQQEDEARRKRRMGIGITGLADLFLFMRLRYASPASIELAEKVMFTIAEAAYRASCDLAREKGPFAVFDAPRYCEGRFLRTLPEALQRDIRKHGLRNSHLISIAPTGTISLYAGNVSSGLEPVFALHYTRRIRRGPENDQVQIDVRDYAYAQYLELTGKTVGEDLPEFFVDSSEIAAADHIAMQAALQKYVDSSISKTINVPADYPFEAFKDVYALAYRSGLKGCTTFRPNEHITGVLVKKEEPAAKTTGKAVSEDPLSRPEVLHGTTYKIRTPLSSEALYLTVNDVVDDGVRRPYELFINTKNLQHFSWIVAMTRLISAVFRREKDPSFLVEELKSIYDPNGGYFRDKQYVPSLAADIGRVIERHLKHIGLINDEGAALEGAYVGLPGSAAPAEAPKPGNGSGSGNGNGKITANLMICPHCNDRSFIYQEGCWKCLSCGYSKCG